MHGHSLGSAVLLNAEVDSMGGVIDGGVGIDNKTSPRQAAIEKAQAELRQEHDVREERKRELEFLEKGGNPLDFKFGSATSVSFQSTSIAEQFVPSEGKGSFALTASPLGDSVESSGRPAVPAGCDPNTADNLLLFDVENGVHEGDRNSIYPSRKTNIDLPDHSSQLDGNHSIKEPGNSAILPLGVKSQAYHRRNRSRPKRDSGRASTADVAPGRDGTGSSTLPSSPHGSRDAKGSVCEASTQKGRMTSSICKSQSTSLNHNAPFKTFTLDGQLEAVQAHGIVTGLTKTGQYEGGSDGKAPRHWVDGENNQHVGDQKNSISTTFLTPDLVGEREEQDSGGHECTPSDATAKIENQSSVSQLNGFRNLNRDGKNVQNEGQNSNAAFRAKDLDSEVSCFQANLNLDGNDTRDIYSNGNPKGQIEDTSDIEAVNGVKENNEAKTVDATVMINDVHNGVHQNNSTKGPQFKLHKEMCNNRSSLQEVKSNINVEGIKSNDKSGLNMEKKLSNLLSDNSNSRKASLCPGRTQGTMDSSRCDIVTTGISGMGASSASELLTCTGSHLKLEINKAREDSILEEARIIEAKRKRIAELSVGALPIENRRRSHWDFVLEEMAWLANDFMQERLWKTTAAAQICHQVAFAGRLRFDERNVSKMQRQVAQELAKAVMQFWRSAEVLLNSSDLSVGLKDCKSAVSGSRVDGADESVQNKTGESDMVTSKQLEGENPGKSFPLAVQAYAVRFLKYNTVIVGSVQAETPVSTNRISNFFRESSWKEDQFVGGQENLFYTVPAGAMETYRKHIESYMVPLGRSGSITQREEVETSMYDGVEDFGSRVTVYEEEEGETSTYYMAGTCEGRKSLKSGPKKRKNLPKSYTAKSYDLTAGLPYENCMENKLGTQQSFLVGKRPASNPHAVSIPTKRVRTAARHRVISPFSVGPAVVHTTNKNDISSGDTSSFQDDLSTLVDGSHFKKSLEVESSGDFGKQMPFDCTEISTKPKKKKKAKNLGSAYEQRWQLDSMVQSEQRDPLKRRLESHLFESNGNGGLFSQHTTKKPKIKHPLDTSESMTPLNGSLPSPVASQMSNMSNSNKLMKMIAGRDRGRKAKALKMPAGQSGSGSPWSLFEDQALVVLVHDMGPNWELVSDAINSTLQFKCIFRKAKECKERHKILMDRNTGDGADSAEDSGCSQPYPSTLPGIPKGSARQLFERLQGPMEEDILKAHFEKIILIGQNKHSRRSQSDSQDLKQLVQVHNSHALTLSQVCPNNLNGGSLTPLDLCEETTSSSDLLSLGYQGPHSSGLAISNQGSVAPALTSSGGNTMLGSSLPLPPAAPNTSYRDGRFGVPRSASLPIEEQQRVQQYNHMISGRTIHPSSLSAPRALSVSDRGVRMLPGGSGMGMMCGMNRNMMMARPGYQGIASPAMLTSGSMLSSCGLGMPNHANMHSGTGSGPGNAMLRPQEALHMMRPGQNAEDQRQMMIPELQMQVTEGHSQGTIPFSGLSSGFSNQTVSTPLRTYPVHNQQQHQMTSQQSHLLSNSHHPHMQGTNHATSPQQQTMIRLARERHQRYLQQQQHQFAASNASMPYNHAQPQSQNLLSSSLQNGSRIHQQQSSEPVSLPPTNSQHPLTPSSSVMTPISSQHQQKHLVPPNGLVRNPQAGVGGSLTNQMLKPRQRQQQQLQQPVRHHHQQRQQSQSQPHAKLMKGLGRGNMMMHQNLCVDSSHVNGLSTIPGNQVAEKGEQVLHQNQGHGLYSGSGSNPVQPAKQLVPQSSNQPQKKLYPIPLPPSSNQLQQIPSHSESSNQGQVPPIPSGHTFVASQQSAPPLAMASSPHHHHLHPQPQPRQVSQSQQTIQRIIPQNHQVESDPFIKSSVDQVNQQLVNNTFQMSPTTSSSCTESTSVIPIVSSACAPQWKVPEQLYDSGTPGPATHLTAIGNSSLLSPVRSESMLASSPGLTQGQVAGSIPTQRHSVEAQWQQQQQPESQLRPSSPLQHLHQQQQPPPPQNQQQHHHHQHQLHLQQLPQPSPLPSSHQQQQQ